MVDIRGYTLLQLRAFTEAADGSRRRALADQFRNLRAVANLDQKCSDAYLKALSNG